MAISLTWFNIMSVAARLSSVRKQKGLTQQALADAVGLHVTQVKRYEAGASLPSLEAIKKIAQVLRVTTDSLIFEEVSLRLIKLGFAVPGHCQHAGTTASRDQAIARRDDYQIRGRALVLSD